MTEPTFDLRAPSPGAARDGDRAAIWVVDDAADFRDLVTEIGDELGIRLRALDERRASAALSEEPLPRGVLIDSACVVTLERALVEQPVTAAERIVVCTARRLEEVPESVRADPRVRVLPKPFELSALESALLWLEARPSA